MSKKKEEMYWRYKFIGLRRMYENIFWEDESKCGKNYHILLDFCMYKNSMNKYHKMRIIYIYIRPIKMKCISRLDLKAIEVTKAESVLFISLMKTWKHLNWNIEARDREKKQRKKHEKRAHNQFVVSIIILNMSTDDIVNTIQFVIIWTHIKKWPLC